MTTSNHTPGQWYVDGDEVFVDIGDRRYPIASVADFHIYTEANAQLIAAAPETAAERDALREVNAELLDVLIHIEKRVGWMFDDGVESLPITRSDAETIRVAIAKATGGKS